MGKDFEWSEAMEENLCRMKGADDTVAIGCGMREKCQAVVSDSRLHKTPEGETRRERRVFCGECSDESWREVWNGTLSAWELPGSAD